MFLFRDVAINFEYDRRPGLLSHRPSAFHCSNIAIPPNMRDVALPVALPQQIGIDFLLALWKSRLQNFLFEFSDYLLALPAVDLFSSAVPKLNSPFHVAHENGIVSMLEEGVLALQDAELIG